MPTALSILRLVAFIGATAFGTIALALSADVIATTEKYFSIYRGFAAMALAVGFLTLATLPVMIVIDLMRAGALTSMIAVEFAWVCVLWILWLTTAALAASDTSSFFPTGCDFGSGRDVDILTKTCREFSAVEAFSFLAWIILLAYSVVLLVYVLIATFRTNAHTSWTSSARTLDLGAPGSHATVGQNPSNFAPQFQPTQQAQVQHPHQQYPSIPSTPQPQHPQAQYQTPIHTGPQTQYQPPVQTGSPYPQV